MFSQKRSHKAAATSTAYFYRRYTAIFVGYTLIGVLYTYLLTACDSLPIRLSTSVTQVLMTELSVREPGKLFIAAMLRILPIFVIYVLGVREYEFFCQSRAWNFFFCFAHGISGYRLFYCFSNAMFRANSRIGVQILCIAIMIFALICLLFLYVQMLHALCIAAKGVPIPCLNGQGFSFLQRIPPQQRRQQILRYAKDFVQTCLQSYCAEVIGIILISAFSLIK
jgi:hypothetical protein